ncbi:MAG: dicarboxylate/amino acid:cation symporter [Elusimicrobia bacterium]|nr:dicarboxylate/amino acid:cation symporter [Elusimicrobiota bacterium]
MLGLAAGLPVGLWLGADAAVLGEIGKVVISAIKLAAAPLLILTIIGSTLSTHVEAKDGARMCFFATVNALIALSIGLLLSNIFQPGLHLAATASAGTFEAPKQSLGLSSVLANIVPPSLVQPVIDNAIFPLVVLSLTFGLALRKLKNAGEPVEGLERAVGVMRGAMEVILSWILQLAPFAVFGVVATSVGKYGFSPLKGLAAYVGVGVLGLILHPLIVYQGWLVSYVRMPLRRFWKEAYEPSVYSIGANSSLATLPLTLKALDKLGVSKSASTLGACVGTNLNNDGIILYEAMAVLFVAQAHGLHLSLAKQLSIAFSCLIAAMGIAGVPEAGFISLALVLATAGLPSELLPLLLTVDWILARARSVVNVLGDMMVSILIDRAAGKKFS